MNQVFQGYAHKGIVGLLAMASMLLITVSCDDGSTGPTEADSLAAVKDSLTIPFDAGDSTDRVTGGEDGTITLPVTGDDDTAIAWASSSPAVIDSRGRVTPAAAVTTLTLTATISKNGATATKAFTLTVPAEFNLSHTLSYTPLSAPLGIGESASPQWEGGSTEPTATFSMVPAAGGSFPVGIDIDENKGIVSVSAAAAKQDEADYTVSLTGTGNYTGTATATISIAVISLSAAELDRGTDEYRGHYGSFSMDSGHEALAGDYRLALRAAAAAEPGAADIQSASASIVRTLSTTPINVFMSFHMDTDLFDAAADWTQSPYSGGSHALSNARVNTAVLQSGTAYALYAVKADGADDRVHKLLEFTTDSATPSAGIKGMPQAVHTIRNGEPFLLQAYVQATFTPNYLMDSLDIAKLSNTDDDVIALAGHGVALEFFYSSNVPKNEYAMLSKSMETGISADKSAGENMVISVHHAPDTVSSTFVIQ